MAFSEGRIFCFFRLLINNSALRWFPPLIASSSLSFANLSLLVSTLASIFLKTQKLLVGSQLFGFFKAFSLAKPEGHYSGV